MKLINSALTYRISLPAAQALAQQLPNLLFCAMPEGGEDLMTYGFVMPAHADDFVLPFEGGYAFAFRYDDKIIPATVVSSETAKRIQQIEQAEHRRVGRQEVFEIRESTTLQLRRKALMRSKVITCFYRPAERLLIVPTSNEKMAGLIVGALVKAIGAAKTETIHVSEARGSLTTRLTAYLDGDLSAFDGFSVGNACKLQTIDGKAVSVKMDESLSEARQGLQESIAQGGNVTEIALFAHDVHFRLSHTFAIKGVKFANAIEDDADDQHAVHCNEYAVRTLQLANVIEDLCELLGYQEAQED